MENIWIQKISIQGKHSLGLLSASCLIDQIEKKVRTFDLDKLFICSRYKSLFSVNSKKGYKDLKISIIKYVLKESFVT